MPATEIEADEDDTKLHFDVESDFPRFLDSVIQRTDQISQTKVDEEIVEQHTVVVDQTERLLRIPKNTPSQQFEYQILPIQQLYGYDPGGSSPSEEDNKVVVELISLDKRHSIEYYVLDVVDPLTQSTLWRLRVKRDPHMG